MIDLAATMAEARSYLRSLPDEERHRRERLAVYAVAVADELGLDQERLVEIRNAAFFDAEYLLAGVSLASISVSKAFDQILQAGQEDELGALDSLNPEEFAPNVVQALRNVHPLIQPVQLD
jgi:hypothetical protein